MNNDRYRWSEKKSHTEHLEHLLHRPKKLGILQPVLWAAKELLLYKPSYPELATDIDLIYRTPSDIWIAEFKTSPGHLTEARKQLDIGTEYVKANFNTTPRRLYVTGTGYDRIEL